jgi:hypothetical protein
MDITSCLKNFHLILKIEVQAAVADYESNVPKFIELFDILYT